MIALLLSIAALAQDAAPAAATGPNVIVVLTDDQGYGDFGFTGNPHVRTPALDRLAAESVRFTSFYVTPVCSTTRASLLTGRYHPRTGVTRNRNPMDGGEVTLAEELQDAGYATGLFGKWHLGRYAPCRPQDQGFRYTLTFRGGILRELEPEPVPVRYQDPMLLRNGEELRAEGYATDVFFAAAERWIERVHEERPFFAWIATNAPHKPYDDPPREELAAYLEEGHDPDTACVYAMVSRIDRNVARLVAKLDELGIREETILVFLSDNGPAGDRWSAGLTGVKSSVREGGIRVPLLVRWPGRLAPRVLERVQGASPDLLPTILELCDLPPAPTDLDGVSLVRALEGRDEPLDRTLFFHAHEDGDYGLNYAVRAPRWKLVHQDTFHATERATPARLYDLLADPLETKDLAGEEPDVVAGLEEAYATWLAELRAERDLAAEPPLPRVGTNHKRQLLLTKTTENPDGAWDFHVPRMGGYDLEFRFAPAPRRGVLLIRASALAPGSGASIVRMKNTLQKGQTVTTLEDFGLTPGPWRLSTEFRSAGKELEDIGVWQVRIRPPRAKRR